MHFAFSFGVQAAEVEVNKLTGEVRVLKVISANDVGMAVNPLGLQGQVEGGVMMGLGNCLTEEFIVENGYVVTDHLARYRIPGRAYAELSHARLNDPFAVVTVVSVFIIWSVLAAAGVWGSRRRQR